MIGHYARWSVIVVALAALLVGCGADVVPTSPPAATATAPSAAAVSQAAPSPTASSAGTSSSPVPSGAGRVDPDAWAFADVLQPDVVTQAPSLEPGFHCSPCHPAAASQLFGVTGTSSGFLGVGVQQPPAIAVAVATSDGRTWEPVAWDPGERTTAIAAASLGDDTVVVGSGPTGAAAWVLRNGAWTPASGDALEGEVGATAMTAVVASGDGFVAGGYRDDPLHAAASAAAWSSRDGLTWKTEGPAAVFAGGRIDGIAAQGDVVVAVGTAGDPTYGPAAAWVRTDGSWHRASIQDPGGAMHAVAATADGFVAVGQNADDSGARVWRSTDGTTWAPVADQPAFHALSGPIRMLSLAADGRGLVAGGWTSDAANGSSAAWTSPDGERWDQAAWVPAFSGGQIRGLALTGDSALGVGRSGYPDNNQAAAWIRRRP